MKAAQAKIEDEDEESSSEPSSSTERRRSRDKRRERQRARKEEQRQRKTRQHGSRQRENSGVSHRSGGSGRRSRDFIVIDEETNVRANDTNALMDELEIIGLKYDIPILTKVRLVVWWCVVGCVVCLMLVGEGSTTSVPHAGWSLQSLGFGVKLVVFLTRTLSYIIAYSFQGRRSPQRQNRERS